MIIDVDLVIEAAAIGALGVGVLAPEMQLWRQAGAARLTPREWPKVLTDRVKWLQRNRLAAILPYQRAIRPTVIKNKSGAYLAAWRIAGAAVGVFGLFALPHLGSASKEQPAPSSARLLVGPGSVAIQGAF